MTSARTRAAGWAALVVALALALSGCARADSAPPAEQVPALAAMLDEVEAAVVDGRFGAARRQIDELVERTVEAVEDGELDEDAGNEILAAAAQVRALLPAELPDGEVNLEPKDEEKASTDDGGTRDRDRVKKTTKRDGGGKDRKPGKGNGPGGKKGKGHR